MQIIQTGSMISAEQLAAIRAAETRKTERRISTAELSAAAIPERWRGESPNETLARMLREGDGLWISGPVGVGKTREACRTGLAWIRGGGTVYFAIAADVVSGAAPAASMGAYDLVILDDLGKGYPSELAVERLFQLIDARYRRRRKILVTSQHSPAELAQRMAARGDGATAQAIVSRLMEQCTLLVMDGEDKRVAR